MILGLVYWREVSSIPSKCATRDLIQGRLMLMRWKNSTIEVLVSSHELVFIESWRVCEWSRKLIRDLNLFVSFNQRPLRFYLDLEWRTADWGWGRVLPAFSSFHSESEVCSSSSNLLAMSYSKFLIYLLCRIPIIDSCVLPSHLLIDFKYAGVGTFFVFCP